MIARTTFRNFTRTLYSRPSICQVLQSRSYSNDVTINGTPTHENLRSAFAGEAMKVQRYRYFAIRADSEGQVEIANLFRAAAKVAEDHSAGHLDFLLEVNDPATGEVASDLDGMLDSASFGTKHEGDQMYNEFAQTARNDGFEDIAEWFEKLAGAQAKLSNRFNGAVLE
ncbi:hypothetical protein AKO1_011389 [Acrasis kona]|uniref:Ferritin-like diiron domain-containing protein n=1 Tax=Acrasis kona TaxID=1008807 RepID=A0AAW2YXP7_9EUKA